MRQINLIAFSALVFLAIAPGCKKQTDTAEEPTIDVSLHDNLLMLEPYLMTPTLSFTVDQHSITSGQPWSGVTASVKDGVFTIDARAGRHGSSSVAGWFKSHATIATCCADCGCAWPSDLNFAFTGTITINGDAYPVTIAQGNSFGQNNWWIGGPGWSQHSGITYNVVTPDGKYYFEPVENTSDQIWIKTAY